MFSTNIIDAVKKQSIEAIDVFTKTIEKLQSANNKAVKRVDENDVKIAELAKENDGLQSIVTNNNTLITKINTILS